MLAQCIDGAVAALQALEVKSMKVAERDLLAKAWRQLAGCKAAWAVHFPADVLAAFTASVAATPHMGGQDAPTTTGSGSSSLSAFPDSGKDGINFDNLTLVDDAAVAQAIDSQRLLQQILPPLEQKLAELDALISTALGLPNVMPEHNPLRPSEFTRLLQDLMVAPDIDKALPALWAKHMAAPFGQGLKTIYANAVSQLEAANVQAAQYRVLQTPAGVGFGSSSNLAGSGSSNPGEYGGSNGSGGSGRGSFNDEASADAHAGGFEPDRSADPSADPSFYADLSDQGVRQDFFDDFMFRGGNNAGQSLAPAYYQQVDEELAELSAQVDDELEAVDTQADYQHLPSVDRPQREVNAASHLSTGAWGNYGKARRRTMVRTQLKKEATQVGQVMGLEVVRQLVNQVAQDPRLLGPVREAIVALEPSLLRLAMVDPRFFTDERHVGRALMERTAQRSFKYNDEYATEFAAFFNSVNSAFNTLNDCDIKNTQPFAQALHALESSWNSQDQQESENRQAVLQALRFAEQRQASADEIAFDLSARSDLSKVPGLILDFLFGPWSLVLAHARLLDQRSQVDPEGYGSVVPDLIWSVKREATLKQPAKFMAMLPSMLVKLHAGLGLLGQTPAESNSFFEALMQLHQPVLKLRRLKTQRDAEESNLGSLDDPADGLELSDGQDGHSGHDVLEFARTPQERLEKIRADAQPLWMGKHELDAAGFEDTQPSAPAALEATAAPDFAAATSDVQATPPAIPGDPAAATAAIIAVIGAPSRATARADTATSLTSDALPGADEAGSVHTKEQAQAMLLGLRAGSWVDLFSKRRWLRAQLVWASTKSTLFMFLSHGGQPHSMTSRSCEKLIMQNLLRPVDTAGVVAKALNAVAVANSHANELTRASENASAKSADSQQNLLVA